VDTNEIASVISELGDLAVPAVLLVLAREWHRFDKTMARLSDSLDRLAERVDRLEKDLDT